MDVVILKSRQPQDMLATAAALHMLALGFAYPDTGHKRMLMKVLARLERRSAALHTARLRRALAATSDCELQAEYGRLFMGSGACPLHETAYGDGRRIAGRAHELSDINGFYSAFSVEVSRRDPDLPDHVSAELEFYSMLLLKLAYAQTRRHNPGRAIILTAARRFLEQHLGRWVGALAAAVIEHSMLPFYRELAQALEQLIAAECRRLRVRSVAATRYPLHDNMQEESFMCPREPAAAPAGPSN